MSDNGDGCVSMEGCETTVEVDEVQANGTNDVDGGYGTLTNTPSSSTETLNNDDLKVDPMEVDEVASNGVDEVSSNGTVMEDLNMELPKLQIKVTPVYSLLQQHCGKCKKQCDDTDAVAGACGHKQCKECWKQSNCLCSTCNMYSENLRSTFPPSSKDVMSSIDEQHGSNSKNTGVLLKTNSGTASTAGTQVKIMPHATKNKGVLLKSSPDGNISGTASFLKPNPPTASPNASASDTAQIRIKCMNGKTLEEKVNPSRMTVGGCKQMVHERTGISMERQHLLHRGKTMTDKKPLSTYSVANGSTIQMAEKCYGG